MSTKRTPRKMSIIDPYATDIPMGGANATPPSPGTPTSDDHLLRISVPHPENTTLHLGAGTPPGIRMTSDTHIHVTAAKPQSTISLGKAAGDGVADFPDGIGIATDGDCKEVIKGSRSQVVNGTERLCVGQPAETPNEFVNGRFTQVEKNDGLVVRGKRQATIGKNDGLDVGGDAKVVVLGKYDLATGERTEEVSGDYTLKVNGKVQKHEDAEETLVVGFKRETRLGGSNEFCVGEKTEMTAALLLEGHALWMEKCLVKVEKATVHEKKLSVAIEEAEFRLRKYRTELKQSMIDIRDAVMSIWK